MVLLSHFYMLTVDQFLKKIDKLDEDFDQKRIKLAYDYAANAHEGQKRYSGEPYITHPLQVAYRLLDFSPDEDMIVAALLHDVSEDTEKTLDDIEDAFGPSVRNLVRGLEKLSKVRSRIDEPAIENLRKMFVSMAADIRVILIKLCDRWHNMETLGHVRPEKQKRIAKETLDIYVPIASRLGIYRIKSELEDLCFQYVYPDYYDHIHEQLKDFTKQSSKFLSKLESTLTKFLTSEGYNVSISSRMKTSYSIYRKLRRKGKSNVDDIFDVFALRIVLPTVLGSSGAEDNGELYKVLGVIHSKWTPLANRFKDYVAVPKPNGYRSLHTTVIGLGPKEYNKPVEIQLRTEKMHQEAEFGVASHLVYKETGGNSAKSWFMEKIARRPKKQVLESQISWVKALDQLQSEISNNAEFIENLQVDLFNDRIFVLTPDGEVKDLPFGATPIDFAYAIHTDIGNRCHMAKVNGSVVPLDAELRSGQVVEILTKKKGEPNQYWLSFVKTASAKNKIKNYFKGKDSEKNTREGRDLLNKYLERIGKPVLDSDYSILKFFGGNRLTVSEREKVLEEIGLGMILPSQVVKAVFPLEDLLTSNQQIKTVRKSKKSKKKVIPKEVLVDGLKDLPVKFASCCKPRIGDPIDGFITRGNSITVHKSNCKIFNSSEKDRRIGVSWAHMSANTKYRVNLVVELEDRIGLLRDLTMVVSNAGVNIVDISLQRSTSETVKLRHFILEVDSYEQLENLMSKIERIDNIISVKKID
jgi:GTP pyrophosphokinase